MIYITNFLVAVVCLWSYGIACAQVGKEHERPGMLNPVLPGYFADPTIKKIGDTYYIYATTDGTGWGAGPSQVWTSKDLRNWTIQPMNWPNTHWYWAPDMTQGYDGRYYLFYSQPVEIFGAVSDTPTGPWESLAQGNKSIIPNYMIPGVITLDAQTFTDDDGRIYMFWGTWGIYPDHGCAVGLLNKDMKSFEKIELIPNTVAKEFFEAPFMFKRDGIYYMMYSSGHCEDHTYRVQYVKSTVGPIGPFEYPEHNPILVTNEDGTIHGPGHHSVLEEDGRYFIVYHRHNNPHSGGGFHRQVAVDEMFFTEDGEIKNIVPTHSGVPDLLKADSYPADLAFGKEVTVSSYYSEDFRPSFVVDNNNGTLWRAKENDQPAWLCVDLGKIQDLATILLQFEYPTYAYRYRIETSLDGKTWAEFVNRSANDRWASPILEHGSTSARYVRLHILDTQMPGLPRGLWNMKVYGKPVPQETIWSDPQVMPTRETTYGNIIHIDASEHREGQRISTIANRGLLHGELQGTKSVLVKNYQGKKAFYFDGTTALRSTVAVPASMGGNGSYTVSMWVNNPEIDRMETILGWSKGNQDLRGAAVGYGSDPQRGAVVHGSWPDLGYKSLPEADAWHHIVISFDGFMERIYVDGIKQQEENRMLFVVPGEHFVVGASDMLDNKFSGYLADLKVYNTYVPLDSLLFEEHSRSTETRPFVSIQTDGLDLGEVNQVVDHGSVVRRFITTGGAKAMVKANRTAMQIERLDDPSVKALLQTPTHTIEVDCFDGKQWIHVLAVVEKGKRTVFINDKLDNAKKFNKLLKGEDGVLRILAPFHALFVYDDALDMDERAERYQIWQAKIGSGTDHHQPTVKVAPRYINERHIFIQLQEDTEEGLFNSFSSGTHSSGWIREPYYLFLSDDVDGDIAVLSKDDLGNVSDKLLAPVSAKRPVSHSVDAGDTFSLGQTTLPFWSGYQVSPNRDSTKTAILLADQTWTLRSKNTRWGDPELLPPYVYQEVEGDFTLEVRVADVAGWAQKVRTSSESGIMVQSADHPDSYVTNTILTGWNVGNLARSVGGGRHREGNTGAGLDFAPYLQVQKAGEYIFVRCSHDGVSWKDLPETPFLRKDLNNGKVRAGLYQIATSNQEGYGVFEEVRLFRE